MSDLLKIEYLDGMERELKILEPVTKKVKILVIPKEEIKRIKDIEDFNSDNAIYFLVKEAERRVSLEFLINSKKSKEDELNDIYIKLYKNNLPQIYIGETTRVSTRYDNHHIKDYDYAIIIISTEKKGFSKNELLYMELRYYNKYKSSIYCKVINNKPKGAKIGDVEKAKAISYIEEINQMLCIIDSNIFTFKLKPYNIKQKGIRAKAYIMDDGLTIVVKGSEAVINITPNSSGKSLESKRKKLISEGILKLKNGKYIFDVDYIFRSKSGAAECILGNSRSGNEVWKEIQF